MIIDIVFIIGLLAMAAYGYKKGFVEVVANLAKILVAFVLAYLFARVAGNFIKNNTNIGTKIQRGVERSITAYSENPKTESTVNSMIEKVEGWLKVDTSMARDKVANKLSEYVFTGIGFVAVYVAVRIVLWVVTMLLDNIFKLPVLKQFNELGGIVAGAALFLIEFSIFLALVKMMSSITIVNNFIKYINTSAIAKTIFNHNIVVEIIVNKIF